MHRWFRGSASLRLSTGPGAALDGRQELWGIVEGMRLRFVSGVIGQSEAEAISSEWRTLAGALGAAMADDLRWRSLTIKSGET